MIHGTINGMTAISKPEKRTKKDINAETKALKIFDNMCYLIESTSSSFIVGNIQALQRVKLSDKGKTHVKEEAVKVAKRVDENKRIVLPDEWQQLIEMN